MNGHLTEEEYLARKRQLEATLAEAGITVSTPIKIPLFDLTTLNKIADIARERQQLIMEEMRVEQRTAIRILSESETRFNVSLRSPYDRAGTRATNRSERLDKKLYEPRIRRRVHVHFGSWPRTSPCWRYIHAHKGHCP